MTDDEESQVTEIHSPFFVDFWDSAIYQYLCGTYREMEPTLSEKQLSYGTGKIPHSNSGYCDDCFCPDDIYVARLLAAASVSTGSFVLVFLPGICLCKPADQKSGTPFSRTF